MRLSDVPTPAFVVDVAKVEANAQRFLDVVAHINAQRGDEEPKLLLRPHIKTHKTVEGTQYQLFASAGSECSLADARVCVATVGEAAFMVDGGVGDVLLAVPISAAKLQRCHELRQRIKRFTVLVDHHAQIDALEAFSTAQGAECAAWSVFLQIDCGGHRCGVPASSPEAMSLAKRLRESAHVSLDGIYTHGGHSYHQEDNSGLEHAAEEERLEVLRFAISFLETMTNEDERKRVRDTLAISIGSTPSLARLTAGDCLRVTSDLYADVSVAVTEIHPGNYIFFDVMQAQLGSCSLEDCAGTVLATVLSQYPARNQVLLDCGALALSKDTCAEHVLSTSAPPGTTEWGAIIGHPTARLISLTQELGVVQLEEAAGVAEFEVGAQVRVVPNHVCLTAACFAEYFCIDSRKDPQEVTGTWQTAPRKWI